MHPFRFFFCRAEIPRVPMCICEDLLLVFAVSQHNMLIGGCVRLCVPSGGGHPGGSQHRCVGDLPAPADGLPLHPVLRVQAL